MLPMNPSPPTAYQRQLQDASATGTVLGAYHGASFGGPVGAIWMAATGHWFMAALLVVMAATAIYGWGRHFGFEWSAEHEVRRRREAQMVRRHENDLNGAGHQCRECASDLPSKHLPRAP